MQAYKPCLLSLFGQKGEADAHGVVTWLRLAYAGYIHQVVNQHIAYDVFIEEFQDWMNCPISVLLDSTDNVEEYQTNWMTYCKVCHILNRRELVEHYFRTEQFTEAEALQMLECYNHGCIVKEKPPKHIPLTDLPLEIIERLVQVFNYHKIATPAISSEDFLELFTTGKPKVHYISCGNTDFALFAFCLRECKLLTEGWSQILCSHKMLLTAAGRPMNSKNIANPSYKFKDLLKYHSLSDKQARIREDLTNVIQSYRNTFENITE